MLWCVKTNQALNVVCEKPSMEKCHRCSIGFFFYIVYGYMLDNLKCNPISAASNRTASNRTPKMHKLH